ncbi:MAG: type VI secretion system domain-containing protein, partial [Acidobacteria bacterium]|nr:type VI secretion system domain-containing protein [Acidobacteriota bacterium]
VWLVDAHIRKEGFSQLAPCFQFLHHLLEDFWDTIYPEIDEDGDMEVRAAPLEWLGTKLAEPLGFIPIVTQKLSWVSYQESRAVGYEADATDSDKMEARQQKVSEGKLTAEQFDEAFDATPTSALKLTRKQLNEGLAALEALNDFCNEKFADQAPSFIKVRDAIEEIAQTVKILIGRKPPEPDDEETPAVDDDFAVSAVAETGDSGPISFEEMAGSPPPAAAPADTGNAVQQIASICKFLRQADPEDPAPYLILRSLAWGKMQANAPVIDHDQIEAPPGYMRMDLKRAAADSDWDKVLDLTESAMLMPCGRTWLDLQRYTVRAIEGLGFAATGKVVSNCLRVFLETLPDVLDLTMPDDTPTANADTRDWINTKVLIQTYKLTKPEETPSEESSSSDFSFDSSSSSDFSFDTDTSSDSSTSTDFSFDSSTTEETPSETPAEPEPEPEPYTVEENPPILDAEEPPPSDLSDEFGQALAAVREGRTAEGLAVITAILSTERSGRARFRRRTQLAHLLMAAGKGKIAQPILDEIFKEIEDRRLEDWEPSEALAYPLELLLHCLSPADQERRAELYSRICKLDPVRAVNCAP